MNKINHVCDKRHMDMPGEYALVRCRHGRIGVQDYAVGEFRGISEPNYGIFCYSAVPSGTVYSLLCMWGYGDGSQQMRDAIFFSFYGQLVLGRIPLDYIIYSHQDKIFNTKHSPESLFIATQYGLALGLEVPINGALVFGRPVFAGDRRYN